MTAVRSPESRFWVKVDKTDDCWLWTAAKRFGGYGEFWDGNRLVAAHRFAYELLVGPIAEGLQLDHLCRVRGCVRPEHLEPVTNRENTMRGLNPMLTRLRHQSITHCPAGHPYSPENTYRSRGGRRHCRECNRTRAREWARNQRRRLAEAR